MVKIPPNKISNPLPSFLPFNAIWKTLLELLLVFLFTPSLFDFKLLFPLQLGLHSLRANYTAQKMKFSIKDFFSKYDPEEIINGKQDFLCSDKYNQFQISENKPDETPYTMP